MEIGHVYEMPPMRPDDAHTTYFHAGAIKIGVEYRDLETAHGPIAEWAVHKIRTEELAPMLAQAGGAELAEGLDSDILGQVADQVAAYAADLQARLAAAV